MKDDVLLDIDGVIANFYCGFAKFLNENYGCCLDIYSEPDCYSMSKWYHGVENVDIKEASKEWVLNNGFGKLPQFSMAKEFVKELMEKYDVFVVTARVGDWEVMFSDQVKNIIVSDTKKWLEIFGVPSDRLFFIRNKAQFCKEHGIKLMIEDKLSTAVSASEHGISTILVNRNYNQDSADVPRVHRVNNLCEALEVAGKVINE